MTCNIHGKNRKIDYLEEFAPGQFRCIAGYQCKTGGSPGPAGGIPAAIPIQPNQYERGPELDVCNTHGKNRKVSTCTQVPRPGGYRWECTPATRCKGVATPPAPPPGVRYNPYGHVPPPLTQQAAVAGLQPALDALAYSNPQLGPQLAQLGAALQNLAQAGGMGKGGTGAMGGRGGAGGADTVLCSLHGKKRGVSNMMEGPPGVFRCLPNATCKGSGEAQAAPGAQTKPSAPCSVHGRNRFLTYMIKDEASGTYYCRPENQCKV